MEKRDYVPLMDIPSNVMILVKRVRQTEKKGGEKDEMDARVEEGMNRGEGEGRQVTEGERKGGKQMEPE